MAGNPEPPAEALTASLLRDLWAAERQLRAQAEQEMTLLRHALEAVAIELAGQMVDDAKKRALGGIGRFDPPELAQRIIDAGQAEKAMLRRNAAAWEYQVGALTVQNQELAAQVQQLEQALGKCQREREAAQEPQPRASAPAAPPGAPAADTAAPPTVAVIEPATAPALDLPDLLPYTADFTPAAAPATWPDGFAAWWAQRAGGGFDKAFLVLQILGRTGEPYLATVMQTAAAWLGLQVSNVYRGADLLTEAGLLHRESVAWKRIKPHLVALNAPGQAAYQVLFGSAPAPQVFQQLRARHKSAPHVYLILETQRQLEAAGYTVERFPAALHTRNGRYEPDLTAQLAGVTVYVEAEIATQKKAEERRQKWLNYWEVTGGQLYLAVVDGPGQKTLLSEVRHTAVTLGLHGVIHILQAGQREQPAGGDIWETFTV